MTKVLYVEDDLLVSEIMEMTLKIFFDKVLIAYDGEEGLELFKKEKPDLIISDILMPKLDGLEMSKEILKINKDAKIILVTADNESNYHTKAKEIGVLDYLQKPIDFEKLRVHIDEIKSSK